MRWGRRAHDLPLLLARSHAEIAGRSLNVIRSKPELRSLERTAEWDVQATQAEVRRWETEEMLSALRTDHARIESADQVAAAARGDLLRLTVQELEQEGQPVEAKLAHNRLMSGQTDAFLATFRPLMDLSDADTPLTMLDPDLERARFGLGVPLHPSVLCARHSLKDALCQSGDDGQAPAVVQAQQNLAQAEAEAQAQLSGILHAARAHQEALRYHARQVETLESRAAHLGKLGADALSLARVKLDWRQARTAARVQAHRLEEAVRLLEALVSEV